VIITTSPDDDFDHKMQVSAAVNTIRQNRDFMRLFEAFGVDIIKEAIEYIKKQGQL